MLRYLYGDLAGFCPNFRLDPFLVRGARGNGTLPQYEVLTVLPCGQDAETFFTTLQHNPALAIAADKRILGRAFTQLQQSNKNLRASFNVNPATVFSGQLEEFLEAGTRAGVLDRAWISRQVIEVLEHRLPPEYDARKLGTLQMKFGLHYALDDVTRDKKGIERIAELGDDARMFKFHHSVLQDVREGDAQAGAWLSMLRKLYPDTPFVLEGFRPQKDRALLSFLDLLGIDAVQIYSPQDETEDFVEESNRVARQSGWGALETHP